MRLALLLALLLTGCVSTPAPVCEGGPLLVPREVPEFTGTTNRDVGLYAVELKAALQSCENDRRALSSPR